MDWRVQRLVIERDIEQMVAQDSQAEDGEGEEVAAIVRRAEDFGEEVRAVFGLGDDVPIDGVEGDGAEGSGEGGGGPVDGADAFGAGERGEEVVDVGLERVGGHDGWVGERWRGW